ncbi:MAG: hypothetical protein IRY88_08145, partial [Rubrobacteraceae bacterium]|nr:hypothetical protein [Rubrobacteraceae bacterium]
MILPAVLVRRGKYSIADPLFVEERRPVLVAGRARRGGGARGGGRGWGLKKKSGRRRG